MKPIAPSGAREFFDLQTEVDHWRAYYARSTPALDFHAPVTPQATWRKAWGLANAARDADRVLGPSPSNRKLT